MHAFDASTGPIHEKGAAARLSAQEFKETRGGGEEGGGREGSRHRGNEGGGGKGRITNKPAHDAESDEQSLQCTQEFSHARKR